MGPLRELLAVDQPRTLEFFVVGLRDVSEPTVDRHQLFYNASVLAHYAQVSTASESDLPTPVALASLFDTFVAVPDGGFDADLLETAGTHCLLMTGFFAEQMKSRHNIRWYAQLGAGFFARAAKQEGPTKRAVLLEAMSREFEPWRVRHARLSRELRDTPFLLEVPVPRRVM